jgi:hypothetical protein
MCVGPKVSSQSLISLFGLTFQLLVAEAGGNCRAGGELQPGQHRVLSTHDTRQPQAPACGGHRGRCGGPDRVQGGCVGPASQESESVYAPAMGYGTYDWVQKMELHQSTIKNLILKPFGYVCTMRQMC